MLRAPLRPVRLGAWTAVVDRRDDGTIGMRVKEPLAGYPATWLDSLGRWAKETPNRVFLAQRNEDAWRTLAHGTAASPASTVSLRDLAHHLNPVHDPSRVVRVVRHLDAPPRPATKRDAPSQIRTRRGDCHVLKQKESPSPRSSTKSTPAGRSNPTFMKPLAPIQK